MDRDNREEDLVRTEAAEAAEVEGLLEDRALALEEVAEMKNSKSSHKKNNNNNKNELEIRFK